MIKSTMSFNLVKCSFHHNNHFSNFNVYMDHLGWGGWFKNVGSDVNDLDGPKLLHS